MNGRHAPTERPPMRPSIDAARSLLLAALAVCELYGCGMPIVGPPADASTDMTAAPDAPVSRPDVSPDVGPDAPPAPDVPPDFGPMPPTYLRPDGGVDAALDGPATPTCRGVAVEDLERLGTRTGASLQYVGSNAMSTATETMGLQPNTTELSARCPQRMVQGRVFRYTTRSAGALVVSTSQPMTSDTFDTLLFVAPVAACGAALGDFVCNDNNPLLPMTAANPYASRVGTRLLPAGAAVLIAVGGRLQSSGTYATNRQPRGTFELVVREVPALADGASCHPRGLEGACAAGSSCAPAASGSQCARDGSAAGASCGPMNTCAAGLACDAARGVCYRTLADGARCEFAADALSRCGSGSTCVDASSSRFYGTCRPNGSLGAQCTSTGTCGAGLACGALEGRSACLCTAARGASCSTLDTACPDGQSCVPLQPGGSFGSCQDHGSVAGAPCDGDRCAGAGLRCATLESPPRCVATANVGEACDARTPCVAGANCAASRPDDRARGLCRLIGAEGGACRLETPLCSPGLTCSDAASPANGTCMRPAAEGGACQPLNPTVACATGSTCAPTPGAVNAGVCRAPGALGASCRAAAPLCDGALACVGGAATGTCVTNATGACDPWALTTRCTAADSSCRATSQFEGTCSVPSTEAEPNDTPATAQRVAGASIFARFDVDPGEIDCFSLDVPAGAALFARVSRTGTNPCSSNIVLELFDPAGRRLGQAPRSTPAGCPMINGPDAATRPAVFAWARDLAAGRYALCAYQPRNAALVSADWVLSAAATAP